MYKRPGVFVNNIRFYILLLSFFLSIVIVSSLRIEIESDRLFYIRTQQIFGFTALAFWYVALLATPLSYLLGKSGWMSHYLFARRALGVSAAYYAVLHALFGLYGQLGGITGVMVLPARFQQVILFGGFGLVVLLIMAITSFDKAISWLTFPRWKWIHRVGYIASIFVLLHVWIIGTHMESATVRLILFVLIFIFAVLESWRISVIIENKSEVKSDSMRMLVFICLTIVAFMALLYIPATTNRYHEGHGGSHSKIGVLV